MTTFLVLCFAVIAIRGFMKERERAELRKSDPQAFVRLEEMDHDKKRMHHETMKQAAGFGFSIARALLGK